MAVETRTALITGAASGIGRATCERLARGGWNVFAVDRDADRLGWAAAAGIASAVADVTSEADNERVAAECEARYGRIDAAAFNAGITGGGSISGMTTEAFRTVLDVNLVGAIHGLRAVLPALRRAGGGSIVVTSSTMGLGGDSENWAYGVAKHGLIGLVRSVAREIGCEGIRINALCPGPTKTGMTGMIEDVAPAHYELLKRQVPLQRWAEADEQAAVIEFLLSPAASYVNGHAMVADGGALVGTGLLAPKAGQANVIPDGINP